VSNNHDNTALLNLVRQIDFESEKYYDLYFESVGAAPPPADISGEVWTNLSSLTADLNKLRNEFSRLRRGVEDLRMPAVETVGLDRVADQLRSLDSKLGPLAARQAPPATQQQDDGKVRRLLKDFLLVVDTIDRVFELAERQPDTIGEGLKVGLDSMYKLITETLGRHGLKAIELKPGDKFDPEQQLAMSTEASQEYPNGTVSQVLTKGYLIGDMILRSAQVVVVRNN